MAMDQYEKSSKTLQNNAVKWHNTRTFGVDVIGKVEEYINSLANMPKEFKKSFEIVRVNLSVFFFITIRRI
ncbi:hypothetical protein IOC57_11855 [Bacillus sp. SD075]|uniref:hypothetical protein n=1 Tax=Bacillus sp. SD075 TaxID=2781732 RepID=UPI001A97B445|nr:hypothetical protein [Bacillus sp. SD075]MBO0998439.1 hypothetical protein [Bacillus sp. SD075]